MSDQIIISLASIPQREDCLKVVIDNVINQCDKINVYLNNYSKQPEFLYHKKITCFKKDDIGDIGKFYNVENESGYYFTIDDDIIYPKDYTYKMIKLIEVHNRKVIVGVHGCTFNPLRMNSYYKDRSLIHYRHELKSEKSVLLMGTGTTAFHTSTIKVKLSDFQKPNMADVWFAILAQKQNVPMILIPRGSLWLKDIPEALRTSSIYSSSKGKQHGDYQTQIIKNFAPWKIIY